MGCLWEQAREAGACPLQTQAFGRETLWVLRVDIANPLFQTRSRTPTLEGRLGTFCSGTTTGSLRAAPRENCPWPFQRFSRILVLPQMQVMGSGAG